LNNLTPAGSIVVTGRVVEITPNVSGQVAAIPVRPNVPVKAGAALFERLPSKGSSRDGGKIVMA
jgi:multidrug efflux pump subunit AcrA (membrane-fusion protein)